MHTDNQNQQNVSNESLVEGLQERHGYMHANGLYNGYRRTSHTKFDIKLHFVWITKFRQPLLPGTVAARTCDLVRPICTAMEVEILKGYVSKDHVHQYVSCPPHVSPSHLMHRVKGRTSRKLLAEFGSIRKACWGRHVWGRGFFVASTGNVTDDIVREYIEKQDVIKPDDNFKVSDEGKP
jgi:putative transposase